MTPPHHSLEGKVIAQKYQLAHALSAGSMGQVYLAEHIALKQPRAVKLLHAELLSNPTLRKRFLREVKATHLVGEENDHIVKVYDDFGFEDEFGYYVMEYLHGSLLSDRIEENPGTLDIDWCIRVAVEICDAMEACHRAGVIHRDLKPLNIFLVLHKGQQDFVKIVDFGIAKVQHAETQLTQQNRIMGTIFYMSPEQIQGQQELDGRSDIYALGCILFEMLTGQPPFQINGPLTPMSQQAVLISHIMEEPPSLQKLRPEVSPALEEVVLRALSKKSEDRFASMQEFADALRQASNDPEAATVFGMDMEGLQQLLHQSSTPSPYEGETHLNMDLPRQISLSVQSPEPADSFTTPTAEGLVSSPSVRSSRVMLPWLIGLIGLIIIATAFAFL